MRLIAAQLPESLRGYKRITLAEVETILFALVFVSHWSLGKSCGFLHEVLLMDDEGLEVFPMAEARQCWRFEPSIFEIISQAVVPWI
jgi:hypothetical protein